MTPHGFVGLKTSVTFTQLRIAPEAIPEMSVAIRDPKRIGSNYEFLAVGATEMVDHFRQIPQAAIIAKPMLTDVKLRHWENLLDESHRLFYRGYRAR